MPRWPSLEEKRNRRTDRPAGVWEEVPGGGRSMATDPSKHISPFTSTGGNAAPDGEGLRGVRLTAEWPICSTCWPEIGNQPDKLQSCATSPVDDITSVKPRPLAHLVCHKGISRMPSKVGTKLPESIVGHHTPRVEIAKVVTTTPLSPILRAEETNDTSALSQPVLGVCRTQRPIVRPHLNRAQQPQAALPTGRHASDAAW